MFVLILIFLVRLSRYLLYINYIGVLKSVKVKLKCYKKKIEKSKIIGFYVRITRDLWQFCYDISLLQLEMIAVYKIP